MKRMKVATKRAIDSEITGQLLKIDPIRGELMAYANRFMEKYHTDTRPLLGAITLHELCSLSVKGGLGLSNLKAQISPNPPDTLVWDGYAGDCDLNLVIKQDKIPKGKTVGEVMAAVAQRIKILLVEAIEDTRYSTLLEHLPHGALGGDKLYRCSQLEALAKLIDFSSKKLDIPLQVPVEFAGAQTIVNVFKDLVPILTAVGGANLKKVFDLIMTADSKDWLVYCTETLFFVSDLNRVNSAWNDVDHSFFPYAPGRMDALGHEVSELAIDQQKARQKEAEATQPYDVFKIITSDFRYSSRDITEGPVSDDDDTLFEPEESYNLSMYANNLIDDFTLIRTALKFLGYSVEYRDVPDTSPEAEKLDVRNGAGKCEFVDVAVPHITSPEWYFCQDRTYYHQIPDPVPDGQWGFKVCDFDYQLEENVNLIIENSCGLSHSAHKLGKRIARMKETWVHCDHVQVFPRKHDGPRPASITEIFDAPKALVDSFSMDYQQLYSIHTLPDWLYDGIFLSLKELKDTADTGVPDDVVGAAKKLGETGIFEMMCMADVVDGPAIAELRALLEDGHIKVNWVVAAYLLLKASQVADVIWFPTFGIFQVENPEQVQKALAVTGTGKAPMAAGDLVKVDWDARPGVPPLTYFPIEAGDVMGPSPEHPTPFFGHGLDASRRAIYREIRFRLRRANNQMLRIAYGRMLNALMRGAADSYSLEK
ncbi:hypothetical protein [Desulfoluna spongiiphila]|uniref:Uncharacterized protein n=1 Tax=Desulfoluna spongiiphila TaxID=419481 RepID=A0A1G5DKK0_9BACT|nr:hypothetical protein [Desulfoluna spongiiphila]SCY15097.1 hypothetical protein SAMN05216233_104238 [Desulfoluna spongiiphila]